MVALRPEVEKLGLVFPSLKAPHSGCPLAAQPCGSLARAMMSAKPISVLGHPNASAMGRGMAKTSGVSMSARYSPVMGGWPRSDSRWFSTDPQAPPAGGPMFGGGPSRGGSPPAAQACSPAPDDFLLIRTKTH